MSPILGIWASAQQSALNAGSYESISSYTVGSGGTSTITFSSIPSTYTHLQIRSMVKNSVTGTPGQNWQFNSDTSSNYSWHLLYGNGSSVTATAGSSQTYFFAGTGSAGSVDNTAGAVVDILDYTSTTKAKTVRALAGADGNGSGIILLESGAWYKNSSSVYEAINTITITSSSGSFSQYSSFALYGIKA